MRRSKHDYERETAREKLNLFLIAVQIIVTQSAGAVKYTDSTSAEG